MMTRAAAFCLPTLVVLSALSGTVSHASPAHPVLPPATRPVATPAIPPQLHVPPPAASAQSQARVSQDARTSEYRQHVPLTTYVLEPVSTLEGDALPEPTRDRTFDTSDRPARHYARGTPPSGRDDAPR